MFSWFACQEPWAQGRVTVGQRCPVSLLSGWLTVSLWNADSRVKEQGGGPMPRALSPCTLSHLGVWLTRVHGLPPAGHPFVAKGPMLAAKGDPRLSRTACCIGLCKADQSWRWPLHTALPKAVFLSGKLLLTCTYNCMLLSEPVWAGLQAELPWL